MKKILCLIGFFCCFLSSQSQERLSVLLNLTQSKNNFTYEEVFGEVNIEGSRASIILPANDQYGVSLRKSRKSGVFYEVLLAGAIYRRSLEVQKPLNPLFENVRIFTSTNIDVRTKLELGTAINTVKFPNLSFGLSASLDPRFSIRNFVSHIGSFFPSNLISSEIALFLNPQIEYAINNRINFQVKMPLQFIGINSIYGQLNRPNLPIEEQTVNKLDINFFFFQPTYSFGVGYYISHADRR